jgi:hypothetical protein
MLRLWNWIKSFFRNTKEIGSIEIAVEPKVFLVFENKTHDEVQHIIEHLRRCDLTDEIYVSAKDVTIQRYTDDTIIP